MFGQRRQQFMMKESHYDIYPRWRNGVGYFAVWFWEDGIVTDFGTEFFSVEEAKQTIERHKKERRQKRDFFNEHHIIKISGEI